MPIVPSPHVETFVLSQRSMHRVRDRALKKSFKDAEESVEVHRSCKNKYLQMLGRCMCSASCYYY